MFQKMLLLSAAGGCGTLCRYLLCVFAEKVGNGHFPLGTFSVNIIGSFIFGLLYGLAERKLSIGNEARLILLTGFTGAFTTFSAFAFETTKLLKNSQWILAVGNVSGQIVLGIAAIALGVFVGSR